MILRRATIFLLIIIGLSVQQFAQSPLKKGVYTLTGEIEGRYDKGEYNGNTDETYVINLTPSFGYFITDNILIGGSLGFNYYEDKYTNSSGRTSSYIMRSLNFGPWARYYFDVKGIVPYLGVSVGYSKYLGEDSYGINCKAEGGINYFLSNSVALEPYISYRINKFYKPDEDAKSFMVGMRVNFYIIK